MNNNRWKVLLGIWLVMMCAMLVPSTTHNQALAPQDPPVLAQDFTTDSGVPWQAFRAVAGGIPSPGPNQKRTGQCDSERSEVEINGGCWVKTEHPLPCPPGKQWEHGGRCYLPVAHAKPLPQSGGRSAGPVAE